MRTTTGTLLLALTAGVIAQDFAGSLFSTDIFEDTVSSGCISKILSSKELMAAYQSCGGMGLFAFPYMPYQSVLESNLLPGFCSSNCTDRLASLTSLGDDECAPTTLPLGLLKLPLDAESRASSSKMQVNMLRLLGGIPVKEMVDILASIRKAACAPMEAARNKDVLVKEDYCLYDAFTRSKNILQAKKYNVTLQDLFEEKSIVCSSSFNTLRAQFGDQGVQKTTPLYSSLINAQQVLKSSLGSCDPKSLQS
ncbi:hypothetical protein HDU96_010669 [Phlyctochytrium bullatum]|nr:hypothetical protein HDU96_010669 [Phlyctochytrium bullatum]